MESNKAIRFEIFGKVQKVYFRKSTKQYALSLGLVGWVKNTSRNTVKGEAQGAASSIVKMKSWLRTKGSKMSRIDRAEITEEPISELKYKDFEIKYE